LPLDDQNGLDATRFAFSVFLAQIKAQRILDEEFNDRVTSLRGAPRNPSNREL